MTSLLQLACPDLRAQGDSGAGLWVDEGPWQESAVLACLQICLS